MLNQEITMERKDTHSHLLDSFCKFTLQINSKANNIASHRELGMWPFIIPILKSSFKFYMRAKCSDHNYLLNSAFRSQLNIKHSSISNLRLIAQYLNGDNILSADIRNKQVLNGLTHDFVNKVRCIKLCLMFTYATAASCLYYLKITSCQNIKPS